MTGDSELAIGSVLAGQFRILARLGAGGMGELYLAEQLAVDRKVAIKIVRAGLVQLHPSLLERFKREARSLAQLSHPNVVQLYSFGETDGGHPFLAMEFVPGDTLESIRTRSSVRSCGYRAQAREPNQKHQRFRSGNPSDTRACR